MNRTHRRRIDDIIEDAFQHACINGDLETAVELVGVLDRKLARGLAAHGADNRRGSAQLARMRQEVDRRTAAQAEGTPADDSSPYR